MNLKAKTPQEVSKFLQRIREGLIPLAKQEMEKLLSLKEEEKKQRNEEFDGVILESDLSYYVNMLREKEFALNEQDIAQYFPLDIVTERMLQIYQEILGLKFTQLEHAGGYVFILC
jgi:Zn-dependent oligopeptidase